MLRASTVILSSSGMIRGIRSIQLFTGTLVAIVSIGLIGCAQPASKISKDKAPLVWPSWPDRPRYEFVAMLGTVASIAVESKDERLQRLMTGAIRTNASVIDKPSGIAVRDGRIYVAEPSVKAITVMDAARSKLFRIGLRAPNTLARPQSVALDAQSNVYILDSGVNKVLVFDGLGLFKFSIAIDKGFTNPIAVTVTPDGNTIFVVDRGDLSNDDHKVVAFSPTGKEKFRIGSRGRQDGKFNIPLAATVAPNGTLLVADSGNARIQAFDTEGNFKFAFGGFGAELGRFSRPRSIATDSDGNIYVADGGFNNVQIFNAKGELLMPLGKISQDPGPGNYSLIGAIAVDEENRLFVTDNFFKKIDVFRMLSDDEGKEMQARSAENGN